MSNLIKEILILNEKNNIFSEKDIQYIIPLYQRAFAWDDTEISQLITDINDFEEEKYYLGSLIVAKKENENHYEVIDGQQRLTALFLLLNSLNAEITENILTFACRKKSNETLKYINILDSIKEEDKEETLKIGKKIIDKIISSQDFNKKHFLSQLKKVTIYRIEVPKNTDLNRYFEIMNTRGEQLEQHDILKAALMSEIKDDDNKELFAKVWEACSDMTGFVQMHFEPDTRKEIFDSYWNQIPYLNFNKKKSGNNKNSGGKKISEIIKPSFKVEKTDGITDKDEKVRFESIITFPFFLLHTLKVLAADKKIQHKKQGEKLINEQLDDKLLTSSFDKVITNGVIKEQKISDVKEQFSLDFIECLLRCRFLFDKYIIKREYVNENTDGEWSLKQLDGKNQKPIYKNTEFKQSGERENTWKDRTKYNLMLQSCLRVSYTSPKVMHWITETLEWLYIKNCKNTDKLNEYEEKIESIAKKAVKENFFEKTNDENYSMGTDTPHIVFNYLDYLLWKENPKKKFVFEFRNSVEHWYPQNPSEGTFEPWKPEDGLDRFGNLCIIQRNINSKFSNLAPDSKKGTFVEMISKGSLKLREMAEMTYKSSNQNANQNWKENVCKKHESKMIEILRTACGL